MHLKNIKPEDITYGALEEAFNQLTGEKFDLFPSIGMLLSKTILPPLLDKPKI